MEVQERVAMQEAAAHSSSGGEGIMSPTKAAQRRELSLRGKIVDSWKELCRTHMLLELYVTEEKLPGRFTLNLKDASMGPNYSAALAELLASEDVMHLSTVDLSNCRMDTNMAVGVCRTLQSGVDTLVLDTNKGAFSKKGGEALAACVGRLALRSLSLNGCEAGDLAVAGIVKSLVNSPETVIRVLGLRGNGVTSTSVKAVAAFLRRPSCPLESLDLSWNALQSDGAAAILTAASDSARTDGRLKALSMEFCGISDTCLGALDKFLHVYGEKALSVPGEESEEDDEGEESEEDDEGEDAKADIFQKPVKAVMRGAPTFPLLQLSVENNQIPSINMEALMEKAQGGAPYPVNLLFSANQLRGVTLKGSSKAAAAKTTKAATGTGAKGEGEKVGADGKISERTGFRSTPTKAVPRGKGG
jgi:hypothetical protein